MDAGQLTGLPLIGYFACASNFVGCGRGRLPSVVRHCALSGQNFPECPVYAPDGVLYFGHMWAGRLDVRSVPDDLKCIANVMVHQTDGVQPLRYVTHFRSSVREHG